MKDKRPRDDPTPPRRTPSRLTGDSGAESFLPTSPVQQNPPLPSASQTTLPLHSFNALPPTQSLVSPSSQNQTHSTVPPIKSDSAHGDAHIAGAFLSSQQSGAHNVLFGAVDASNAHSMMSSSIDTMMTSAFQHQAGSWPMAFPQQHGPGNPQNAAAGLVPNGRILRVEDALAYLERVKSQFEHQPMVYAQFLEIMKEFKAQTIDTHGVIQRVKTLFYGHKDLILGFNKFLPQGYHIDIEDLIETPADAIMHMGQQAANMHNAQSQRPPHDNRTFPGANAYTGANTQAPNAMSAANSQAYPARGADRGPVEYDHAINYVTKIKNRFTDEPHIYKAFLDILHGYQKEQMHIQEVDERVGQLFSRHTDLLDEFRQFLPNMNPNAKKKGTKLSSKKAQKLLGAHDSVGQGTLPSNAGPSENPAYAAVRQDALSVVPKPEPAKTANRTPVYPPIQQQQQHHHHQQHQQHQHQQHQQQQALSSTPQHQPHPTHPSYSHQQALQPQMKTENHGVVPEKSGPIEREGVQGRHAKTPKSRDGSLKKQQRREEAENRGKDGFVLKASQYLDKVVERIGRQMHEDMTKCVILLSRNTISMKEWQSMAESSLFSHPDILHNLRGIVAGDADKSSTRDKNKGPQQHEESSSRRKTFGHSYRHIPKDFPVTMSSGRSRLCKSVLNDTFISHPTGTEDGILHIRHNAYDEAIFKCEDERHELDVFRNTLQSTIKALEQLIEEGKTPTDDARMVRFSPILSIHLRTIEKMYGLKGFEIMELFHMNPVMTAPVILKRLQQKEQELQPILAEKMKMLKEVMDRNLYKAAEVRYNAFKETDKKALSIKNMLEEAQERRGSRMPGQDHYYYPMTDQNVLDDIFTVLHCLVQNGESDVKKWESFSQSFLRPFLSTKAEHKNLPDDARKIPEEADGNAKNDQTDGAQIAEVPELPASTQQKTPNPLQSYPLRIQTKRDQPKHVKTFFGNNITFVFFRLLQIMYERLNRAKRLQVRENENSKYDKLIGIVIKYCDDNSDVSKMEDEIRSLYGYSGFFLCNLDRILAILRREISVLLQCQSVDRLLSLYNYECMRESGSDSLVYKANALSLIGGDNCFRLEFNSKDKALALEYLEPEIPQAPIADASVESRWLGYVEQFVQADVSFVDPWANRLFLLRNIRRTEKTKIQEKPSVTQNRLECKLSLPKLKLQYTEDTEDFFYRPRPSIHQASPADADMTDANKDAMDESSRSKAESEPAKANSLVQPNTGGIGENGGDNDDGNDDDDELVIDESVPSGDD